MNRLLVLAACGAALLVLAAPAAAKELTRAQICGASGCRTITDRDQLRALPTGGETTAAQPPAAGYYTVTFVIEHAAESDRFTMYYVPASNLLGANSEFAGSLAWFPVYGRATDAIRDAAEGIDAFPAPKRWPSEITVPARTPAASIAPSDGGAGIAAGTLVVAGSAAALCALAVIAFVAWIRRRPARPADSPTTS